MKAPADLSPRATKLWNYAQRRGCKSPGRVLLLEAALRAFDRAEIARGLVARDGLVAVSERSGLARRHPALVIEAEARSLFLRLWQQLELDVDHNVDGGFA